MLCCLLGDEVISAELIIAVVVGILLNFILSFVKQFLFGLRMDLDRDIEARLERLTLLDNKNWKKDKMRLEFARGFIPFAQLLSIFIEMYQMNKFIKNNKGSDALDYLIDVAEKRLAS